MTYELTQHARESLQKRPAIRMEWIERIVEQPERVEPDRTDPELEHRLGRIHEQEIACCASFVNRNITRYGHTTAVHRAKAVEE